MKKLLTLFICPIIIFSQSIQQQIDAVEEGAILNIEEGVYNESISINKSITLNCNNNCIIDASGFSGGVYIEATDVTLSGFEIIGDDETTYGIVITPTCSNINITNNEIHGMSLPNPGNTSPLSYGILTYGEVTSLPQNLNFSNNYIYNVAGSGISLGSFTGSVTITNNTIENLNSVQLLGEDFNVGVQAQFCQSVFIENNNFSNLIMGSNLIYSNSTVQTNNYTDVICYLSHTTTNSINLDELVEWWSVEGTIEYEGQNFDITSYFNSLENAMQAAELNGSNITSFNGDIFDYEGNLLTGCTDKAACNYDTNATIDDGSCNIPSTNEQGVLCDECCMFSSGLWTNANAFGMNGINPIIYGSGDNWELSSAGYLGEDSELNNDGTTTTTAWYGPDDENESLLTSLCFTGPVKVSTTYISDIEGLIVGEISFEIYDNLEENVTIVSSVSTITSFDIVDFTLTGEISGGNSGNLIDIDTDGDGIGDCDEIVELKEELYNNKKIVKRIDILGRNSLNKNFTIIIYEDGSTSKNYFIE